MAKQKKLNKNLVAFLTVMGMVLTLSVVTLIVYQQSRRDPVVLAESAAEARKAGDLEEATRRYNRAWQASRDRGEPNTQYIIDAARCAFDMGELNSWLGFLKAAKAAQPKDRPVLKAILDGLWLTREVAGVVIWSSEWREAGEDLYAVIMPDAEADPEQGDLDPETRQLAALGLASQAQGHWAERPATAEHYAAAAAAARRAFALDPTNPRVAITYDQYLVRASATAIEGAQDGNRETVELKKLDPEYLAEIVPESKDWVRPEIGFVDLNEAVLKRSLVMLKAALAEHPDDGPLVALYGERAQMWAHRLRLRAQEGDAEAEAEASAVLAGAREAYDTAQAKHDEPDPDLLISLAWFELGRFRQRHSEMTLAEAAKLRDELEPIEQYAEQALEVEPALYGGYRLKADLQQQFSLGDDGELLPVAGRLERALTVYEDARERTLTLRSVRAQLADVMLLRLIMLMRGFDTAMGCYVTAEGDSQGNYLKRVEAFLEDARVKYTEQPVTYLMSALYAAAMNDDITAIADLEKAYEKAEQDMTAQGREAEYWLDMVGARRLPAEQLALLYGQRGQFGEAQKWGDKAIDQYDADGRVPPVTLIGSQAEMLVRVGQPQAALDLLEVYRTVYPGDETLQAVRLLALPKVDPVAAERELEQMKASGVRELMWIARLQVEQESYDKARETLQQIIDSETATTPEVHEAGQRLVAVLAMQKKFEEARQLLQQLRSDPRFADAQRMLDSLDIDVRITAAEDAPEQQKALEQERLALLQSESEPFLRAQGLYGYYLRQGDEEQALAQLAEMRRLRPDEGMVVEEELRLRLQREEYAAAEPLARILGEYDGGVGYDRAGGATYRGDLSLARGDFELAIREYLEAVNKLPASGTLQTKLARAYLAAGRTNEGIDTLKRAIEINPRSFEGYVFLRTAYMQKAQQSYGPEQDRFIAMARDAEQKAAELSPDHPLVREWRQQADERSNPLAAIAGREQQRAQNPQDEENVQQLAQLYLAAWGQVASAEEPRRQLIEQATKFFNEAVAQYTGELQVMIARAAAAFYAQSGDVDGGERFVRDLAAKFSGSQKLEMQLLLAAYFEAVGNALAAEREYRQAQRLVSEVTTDPAEQRQLNLRAGMAFIGFHERQRRPDKVAEACRWVLDRSGSAGTGELSLRDVRLTLIQALFNAGQLADAEREIEDFVEQHPDDLQGLVARAQLHLLRNERQEAYEDLTRILEKDPEHLMTLYSRGRLDLERGRYELARRDLERAGELVVRQPQVEAEVRRALASLYERTQRYDLAETQYRAMLAALERDGAPAEQRQEVVRQLARLLYSGAKSFERAQQLISEYMQTHTGEWLWPFELGALLETRADEAAKTDKREAAKADYGQAATYYQEAARLGEAESLAAVTQATRAAMRALNAAERYNEAISAYQNFPEERLLAMIRPSSRPLAQAELRSRLGIEVAKAHGGLGATAAEMAQWQECLLSASSLSLGMMGHVADAMREALPPERVEELVRDQVQQHDLSTETGVRMRVVLATHLTMNKMAQDALAVIGELRAFAKPGTAEHLGMLLTQAQALEYAGDAQGTVQTYREVLSTYDTNVTALNNLAYILVDRAPPLYAPEEAMEYAERLRRVLVGHDSAGSLLDTVGWVYYHNAEYEMALATLEEALSLGGANPALCLHLGHVYQKLNRNVDARTILARGRDLALQDDDQERLQQIDDVLKQL